MYCLRLWDLVEILSMGVLKTTSLYQSKIIIHGGGRRNLAFKWFVWKNQSSLSPCFLPSPSFLSPFFLCFQATAEQQVGQFIGFVLRYKGSIDFYKKLIDIYFLHSCVYLRVEINLLLTTPTDALEQPGFPSISTPLHLQGKVSGLYCGIDCDQGPTISPCHGLHSLQWALSLDFYSPHHLPFTQYDPPSPFLHQTNFYFWNMQL